MKLLICASLILIHFPLWAIDDEAVNAEALQKTQELLRSRQQRDAFIKDNDHAREADSKAESLAGNKQNKDEMYDISAKVMERVVADTKGDPVKMQELLQQAQKDPKGFYEKHMNTSEKAQIRGLATKVQKVEQPVSPRK